MNRTATPLRLLADIGGTHARFALQRPGKAPTRYRVFKTAEHAGLAAAITHFLDLCGGAKPQKAAIAVAAPITGDTVKLTNASWSFSRTRLHRQTGIARLDVLNDFEALSWAVPALTKENLRKVGRGRAQKDAPAGVFGPGTGLGVSCFAPAATGGPAVLATEGGHATLAASTAREAAVIETLRARFGHVSAERVLSGPGLTNLYGALAALDGKTPRNTIRPGAIARAARAKRDPHAVETAQIFSALMGQFGGDLALLFGARGGIYIAGGVIARLGTAFDTALFRRRFEAKGRYRDWLAGVPSYLITHPRPAMLGLARYLDSRAV